MMLMDPAKRKYFYEPHMAEQQGRGPRARMIKESVGDVDVEQQTSSESESGQPSSSSLSSPEKEEEIEPYYENYPLLQSLLRFEKTRNDAFKEEGHLQMDYPLSTSGWYQTLFIIKGRALDWMIAPWVVVVLHATLYTLFQELWFPQLQQDTMQTWNPFFTFVLSSTLSFLLVFRLNRAAQRFWLAREYWGTMVARGRTIVSGLLVYGNHSPRHRDDAIRWLAAFAICTMEYLRGRRDLVPDMFAGLVSKQELQKLERQNHPPLYACRRVRCHLKAIFQVSHHTHIATANQWTQECIALEQQLNVMMDMCGGMERIKGTPLPIVYVSHLRTFLLLTLLLLPYVFGPLWRWTTIPLVAIAAFAWLGIEAASSEVECPFRQNRVNALNMDAYCEGLLTTTLQEVKNHVDDEIETKEGVASKSWGK
jgi:putative membrane protein